MQYSLCRIIQRTSRFSREHISPHLRSLHWLPVKERVKFKWCLLIFKTLKLGLPPYFSQYLFHVHVKYLPGIVFHKKTCLIVMLSLSIEIFTNPICTLKIVLLLVAGRYGIASLKKHVVVILYILFSVNWKDISFIQLFLHNNPPQWTDLFGYWLHLVPDCDYGYYGALEYVKHS